MSKYRGGSRRSGLKWKDFALRLRAAQASGKPWPSEELYLACVEQISERALDGDAEAARLVIDTYDRQAGRGDHRQRPADLPAPIIRVAFGKGDDERTMPIEEYRAMGGAAASQSGQKPHSEPAERSPAIDGGEGLIAAGPANTSRNEPPCEPSSP